MISFEEYIKNPCVALSIPYWKYQRINIPDDMKVIHDCIFLETFLNEYTDEEYFLLFHDLQDVQSIELLKII